MLAFKANNIYILIYSLYCFVADNNKKAGSQYCIVKIVNFFIFLLECVLFTYYSRLGSSLYMVENLYECKYLSNTFFSKFNAFSYQGCLHLKVRFSTTALLENSFSKVSFMVKRALLRVFTVYEV